MNLQGNYITDSSVIDAVSKCNSVEGICRYLLLKRNGDIASKIKNKIIQLNCNTSHFLSNKYVPLSDILIENSKYAKRTHSVKLKLIKEKIFLKSCSNCKLEIWMSRDIPLELHHKNGIDNDFRIENLCLLCPNCHALTDTYRAKNKKRK